MIVIGVDVHKHLLTAVAVDELGRPLAERTGPVDEGLVGWARSLGGERLWALEDCRHVTRGLEQTLLGAGERLVRVPPRLTAPERRRGRSRGKSDALDALAVARVALREPGLEGPRPQEPLLRELKLLVDHRDDLVAERRRCQQRLRWHLHELDPALAVPPGAPWPDRALPLRRPARPPRRRRPSRGQLRQAAAPPARPRRQSPAQLRPPPDRRHPGTRPPTGARLSRAQAGRGQEPPRGDPLPQAPARADRLHDPKERAVIDIGATLAQA